MSRHDAARQDNAGQADMGPEAEARREFAEQEGALCSVPGPNGERDVLRHDEVVAFSAGLKIGARQERRRILADLDAVIASAASLFVEGSAAARAVAAFVARVREVVEARA